MGGSLNNVKYKIDFIFLYQMSRHPLFYYLKIYHIGIRLV